MQRGLIALVGLLGSGCDLASKTRPDDGEHVFLYVMWNTELLQHSDTDCPLEVEDCPQCQQLWLDWYYQQQTEGASL